MSILQQKNPAKDAPSSFKDWFPIICLAFSTFIFNTTEFIPIGLLSNIAKDFSMTESGAGSMITIYAWAVALLSLPLMLVFSKMESKRLLIGVFIVFVLSNTLSYFATSFFMLMISRLGVACAHSIFWAITPTMAARIAPPRKQSLALSILTVGSSIAMILGLPIGRTIGLYVGWRATFLSIAATAFLIMILLIIDLPKIQSKNSNPLKSLPSIFKNKNLMYAYIVTLLVVTGHFTLYSYIEPILVDIVHFSKNVATLVLLIFGAAGIIGSVIFTKMSGNYFNKLTINAILLIFGSVLLFQILLPNQISLLSIICFWGLAISIFNLSFQTQIIKIAPDNTDIAMAIFSAIYNVGIGGGALIGGIAAKKIGLDHVAWIGALIISICLIFMLLANSKKRK